MEINKRFKVGDIKINKNERSVEYWLNILKHSTLIHLNNLKSSGSNHKEYESRKAMIEACNQLINKKLKDN